MEICWLGDEYDGKFKFIKKDGKEKKMKQGKCVRCGTEYTVPYNFYGPLLCESCDPAMGEVEPIYTAADLAKAREEERVICIDAINNALDFSYHGYPYNDGLEKAKSIIESLGPVSSIEDRGLYTLTKPSHSSLLHNSQQKQSSSQSEDVKIVKTFEDRIRREVVEKCYEIIAAHIMPGEYDETMEALAAIARGKE